MMTREMMITAIEALGADASFCEYENTIDVTLQDFEGFDDEWTEIDREFNDEKAVDAFLEMLERECISQEGIYYITYHFNGFDVQVGYASSDI